MGLGLNPWPPAYEAEAVAIRPPTLTRVGWICEIFSKNLNPIPKHSLPLDGATFDSGANLDTHLENIFAA